MEHIFIGGHRRTGTTLLASLLDNHTDIWVYPYETHFWYSFYPEYIKKKYTHEDRRKRILFIAKDLKQITNKWVGKEFDLKRFMGYFDSYMQNHPRNLFGYFYALITSARKICLPNEKKRIYITKDTQSEIHANEIFKIFPEAKFINLIRDPRDNFVSVLAGWDKHYKNQYDSKERLLRDFIDRGYLCMDMAKENWIRFGNDKYKNVYYEILAKYPSKVMEELCQWIGVSVDNLKIIPSFCGVEWKGNSFTESYKGISKKRIGIYKEILTEYQIKVIEYYFGDLMEYYGYALDYKKEECVDAIREHYKWLNANGFHSGKPYRKY